VQTVLGLVDADSLGVTLMHEHLLTDLSTYFVEPKEASRRKLAYEPVRIENLGWIKTHRMNNIDDLRLTDEQVAIEEAMLYKQAGGKTIVEVSSIGLHRDPEGLARISRVTGLNIIMGSGYYVGASHPPELLRKGEEEIAEEITRDILVGVGDTGIRAGIIGEIGCTIPLLEEEKKVLRASALAQQRTGAAISVHPSSSDDLVLEIMDILGEAGADLHRTIICHVNYFGFSRETLCRLADAGCYIEIDNFGRPAVPYPVFLYKRFIKTPSDTQRIDAVRNLINYGYLKKILISHDICFKTDLIKYGGDGYAHIVTNVASWMKEYGIKGNIFRMIIIENPKTVLSFAS
ncbi:MAG: aryldialkylphosphatase, partial [Spirochaetes bacterium]|nr:aryldialkylphosphatase [Spirochaetota bacterium]